MSERELVVGPITRTDIVRFAGAGGDFNPLHHDEPHARAAGFDGVFAMGQMQAGMLSRLVTDRYPLAAVRSYRVRFVAVVRPGDVLTLRWTGDTTLEAVRDDGQVVVRGEIEVATEPDAIT